MGTNMSSQKVDDASNAVNDTPPCTNERGSSKSDAGGNMKPIPKPYAGMRKDELLKYSRTPSWNLWRRIFFYFFILCWLALVVASVVLIVLYPRCMVANETDWWQTTTVYKIAVRSFQDSDGDGNGDIKGIEQRLMYLRDLSVGTILLDSIFETDNINYTELQRGYDVTDFQKIDSMCGTIDDFKSLMAKAHDIGLKVMVTFIPNHTGYNHTWFNLSKHSSSQYKNYYVWADCTNTSMPNNWMSIFNNKSAWTRDETRKQCYLHQGTEYEPDLNLRNGEVQMHLKKALEYWLAIGVDGFYMPRVSYLFEDYDFRDEILYPGVPKAVHYQSLIHTYTSNLPETHDMLARWRSLLDNYAVENETGSRFLLVDDLGSVPSNVADYYGKYSRDEATEPVNPALFSLDQSCGGSCVKEMVEIWMNAFKDNWPNWSVGSLSAPRVASRLGENYVNIMNMLSLLLPGTAVTYYGDEIGMVNSAKTSPDYPFDASQTPMQWSGDAQANFTTGTPWLPINSDYETRNVMNQSGSATSNLKVYKALVELRGQLAFQKGNMHYAVINDNIFSFVKEWDGVDRYLVAMNFGKFKAKEDYPSKLDMIPKEATVQAVTGDNAAYSKGDVISTTDLELDTLQGIVLSWPYKIKEYM